MDEGESEHGADISLRMKSRSLQHVVKADGCAVSLPRHEVVVRRQESPSLRPFPTDSTGTHASPISL